MQVLPTICEFLETHLNVAPERVVPEALLTDLGIDSLMLLELIFECEEKLNITIAPDAVTPTTIAELVAVVEQFRNGSH